jgi:hypothetical protein
MMLQRTYLPGIFSLVFAFQMLSAQTYQESIKLTPSDRDTFDFFSGHLATDGAFAIVGAVGTDENAAGTNFLDNAGGAYLFEYNPADGSWTERQKLIASDRSAGDELGYRVAVSGAIAVATSFRNRLDENGANPMQDAGAAYIFERQPNGNWAELQKLVPADRAPVDRFGRGLAITEGHTIFVGAPDEDPEVNGSPAVSGAGAVYVFEKNPENQWTEQQKLVASDLTTGDNFGYAVAVDGDVALVGAFGKDRTEGGEFYNVAGAAYFFERQSDGEWLQTQKVESPEPVAEAFFGHEVALKGDYAVIAADEESVFEGGGAEITQAGAVYVYHRDGNGLWTFEGRLTAPDPDVKDHFGFSVAIEWPMLLIGAYQDEEDANEENALNQAGAAFIFESSEDGEWEWVQKLAASDRATSDFYGRSVAIAGEQLLVGSFRTAFAGTGAAALNGAGGVYIYNPMTTHTLEAALIRAEVFPNPTSGAIRVVLPNLHSSVEASILTIDGRPIADHMFQYTQTLDFSLPGPAGIYLLRLASEDGAATWRLIKQ